MGKRSAPTAVAAPAGKKTTFGSDDEFEPNDAPVASTRPAITEDSEEDSDDDEAPEMVATSSGKAAERQREKEAAE